LLKKFKADNLKISDNLESINSMVLTKIKKEIYHLSDFMKTQEKEIEINKILFYKSYEKIVKKFMKIYKNYFYRGSKEIQEFWLQFIREMDKEMEKALKSAVKNSLVDLQKHIKGEM
jgi:dynein heavy chain